MTTLTQRPPSLGSLRNLRPTQPQELSKGAVADTSPTSGAAVRRAVIGREGAGQNFVRCLEGHPGRRRIGVGSGLRKTRLALLISHHSSMALSSCVRLWQSFMNMPPQSRNCMKSVTVEMRAVRNR